ncbi:MAG: tRNA (adenosine(37)-N6)-dimethylallyltransferase MiaA [Proteobacteria bacterium]|nr:tRNA (adenosine(37)-N6)-dimethylallyltransferase MiaA [Pseudomonadota bacterium]
MKNYYSIIGPTAVGKSDIAIKLSEILPIEIISCDSRQVYKYMNIGTAKPSKNNLNQVKHHLMDIITPDKRYNAKQFSVDAEKIANDIENRGKIPLIVGGTGMYLNAFVYGMFDNGVIPEDLIRELRELSCDKMYDKLEIIDPLAASKLHKNDRYRLIRALEVKITTGRSIYEFQEQKKPRFEMIYFYIIKDRGELYKNIEHRIDRMIGIGLINEVRSLLDMGYDFDSPGMKTVGYKEFDGYFEGIGKIEDIINSIKKNSRNYAKRQFTWFNKQVKKGQYYIIDLSETNIDEAVLFISNIIKKGIT